MEEFIVFSSLKSHWKALVWPLCECSDYNEFAVTWIKLVLDYFTATGWLQLSHMVALPADAHSPIGPTSSGATQEPMWICFRGKEVSNEKNKDDCTRKRYNYN